MAITDFYVDYQAAGPGDGSRGDPWTDPQTAFDTIVNAGINRVRVKGTSTFSVAWNLTTYKGNNSLNSSNMLIVAGWPNGETWNIDGGGGGAIFNDTAGFTHFMDGNLSNFSVNYLFTVGAYSSFRRMQLEGGGISTNSGPNSIIEQSYFYGVVPGTQAIILGREQLFRFNTVDMRSSTNTRVIRPNNQSCEIIGNNILVAGSSNAIDTTSNYHIIEENNIFAETGATGTAILTSISRSVSNNIVSGFTGGGGINLRSATNLRAAGNSVYNCGTPYTGMTDIVEESGNEILYADPFTDPANLDFSTNDVGRVKEGSIPQLHAVA